MRPYFEVPLESHIRQVWLYLGLLYTYIIKLNVVFIAKIIYQDISVKKKIIKMLKRNENTW